MIHQLNRLRELVVLLSLSSFCGLAPAQEVFFGGGTDSDYNTVDNWVTDIFGTPATSVPTDPEDATIGDDLANTNATATLTADAAAAHRDLRIGARGGVGVLNHSSGTLTTNNWAFVGVDGTTGSRSNGTYNLTGDAVYAQSIAAEARFEVGGRGDSLEEGGPANAEGLVSVDTTGSITTNNTTVGTNGDGRFELINGTHDASGSLQIGGNPDGQQNGTGVYDQSGGTLNVNSGPAPFGNTGGWFSIGNGGDATGTYNLSGGVLNAGVDFMTVGENGVGTWNVTGGDANQTANGIIVGRNDGATGVVNITGSAATIDTTGLIVAANNEGTSTTATGTLNFVTEELGVSPIVASGDVTLGTNAMLTVDLTTAPAGNILLVDVGGTLTGEFAGLSEGAAVGDRTLTYAGGDGNDIYLLSGDVGDLMADFNGDGTVDLLDLDILGGNFGLMGGATMMQGDANGDGNVDLLDLDILGGEFGESVNGSAVPEPTAALLATLAAAGLAGRRRR